MRRPLPHPLYMLAAAIAFNLVVYGLLFACALMGTPR